MSEPAKTSLSLIGTITVLASLAIAFHNGGDQTASRVFAGDDRPVPQAQSPVKQDSFFIRRSQRNTEAFINQVRSYQDFDALVAGLDEPVATVSGPDGVFLASISLDGMQDAPLYFMKVLADRRVARMAEMLENMPADEAERRAAECYESKLKNLTSMWHEVMDARTGESNANATFNHNSYHAVCCALYLCSRYCEPVDVVGMVDNWTSAMEEIDTRIRDDKRLWRTGSNFLYYGRPDELFLFNIYLSCLQQKEALSSEELGDRLETNMKFVTVPLVSWEAPRSSASIAKNNEKGQVEAANDVAHLTFKKSWTFSLRGPGDWLTKKEGMVLRARQLVEGPTIESDVEELIIDGKKALDAVEKKAAEQ